VKEMSSSVWDRLEKLDGNRTGRYGIRINEQARLAGASTPNPAWGAESWHVHAWD